MKVDFYTVYFVCFMRKRSRSNWRLSYSPCIMFDSMLVVGSLMPRSNWHTCILPPYICKKFFALRIHLD